MCVPEQANLALTSILPMRVWPGILKLSVDKVIVSCKINTWDCTISGSTVKSSQCLFKSPENTEPPSKHFKMDFSYVSQLKTTGSSMSKKQLKGITQVIRKVGVTCPSMKD